jgi:alginate O-acetyltransferase complex protein AlgI
MTLTLVLVSIFVAFILGVLGGNRWRLPLLLGASALAVFAFQPTLAVRGLDFWLPTATLSFTVLTWILTTPHELRSWHTNWSALVILSSIILILGSSRYVGISLALTASRPPQIAQIIFVVIVVSVMGALIGRFTKPGKGVLTAAIIVLIMLFVFLKTPALAVRGSMWLRSLNQQATNMALAQDIRWLGFSYIAFRLLHTIRDRQSGRLPAVSLSEYVIYVIFFPTLTAGPIDRIERFVLDLRRPLALAPNDLGEAGKRLIMGLFKKFAIADTLSLIALNATNALQVHTAGWGWVLLYAYAIQIYFDFSGYTDIAIGIGQLLGIHLPENFKAPYLKPNLTQFWNNWHMSLTQWFRAYFFNPLTRAFRSRWRKLPVPVIIFITQLATMVLIGLWHGVTWNFFLWGLWHGLGLFIHNRWSELTKKPFALLNLHWQTILNGAGVFLTFNYVALGWVFFALPEPSISLHFLRTLIGLA